MRKITFFAIIPFIFSLPQLRYNYSFRKISVRGRYELNDVSSDVVKKSAEVANIANVFCFGEVLFDCIYDDDGKEIKYERFPGGAPANVACALAKLGIRPSFAGCVGNDVDGDDLVEILCNTGVNTTYCNKIKSDNIPTRKVMVARKANGDRQFTGFWNNLPSPSFADTYYSPSPEIMDNLMQSIKKDTQAVVVGTLGLACNSPTQLFMDQLRYTLLNIQSEVISHHSNDASTKRSHDSEDITALKPLFIVDINWRPVFWDISSALAEQTARERILQYVVGADLVKLTDEEAQWLLGISAKDALATPQLVFDRLQPKLGVLVSAGELGASCYFHQGISCAVPAFPVHVEETTGAGDAFLAGFIFSLLRDKQATITTEKSAKDALRFASAAGALTCTKRGAISAQPSLKEIQDLLQA